MKQFILIMLLSLLVITSLGANDLSETEALAEQGFVDAQFSLGATYDLGEEGVPQDDAKAAHWYLKAAENGHGASQLRIGRMYLDGRGVPQDSGEAWAWLVMARFGSSRPEGTDVPQGGDTVKYRVTAANPEGTESEATRDIGEDKFHPFGVTGWAWHYYDIATNRLTDEELIEACVRRSEVFGLIAKLPQTNIGQQSRQHQTCVEAVPVIRKDVAEAGGG